MTYTALFQGHPIRFVEATKRSSACALMLDDVKQVVQDLGAAPDLLATAPHGASGQIAFNSLIDWLEELQSSAGQQSALAAQLGMFLHWMLRHMPNAQVALGLSLSGYLHGVATARSRAVKSRAA